MRSAAVAFLVSMAVAAVFTPLVRKLSLARGWLDHAVEARKIHGKPIPRLGGIAIVLGFYAPVAGLLLYPTSVGERFYADQTRSLSLLGAGLAIALLGFYDDLRGAGAAKKFAVQFLVALGLYWAGFRIEVLSAPFGSLALGAFSLPVTLLWIVGVINAMNLIDGLDGLAGGVAFFALGSSFIIAFVRGEATMALLAAALAGSVLGFLFYNFNPASIFMGDTGSMFLGLILAAGSVQTHQKSSTAVALLAPMVALGLPLADTVLALLRRAWRGRPLFSADKEHIHHRLLELGLTQRQSVIVLYCTCALLGVFALILSWANSWQTAATLSVLALLGFFGVRRLGYLRSSTAQLADALATTLRALPPPSDAPSIRAAVRRMAPQLLRATGSGQLWDSIKPLGEALGARRFALALTWARVGGESVTTLYQVGPGPRPAPAAAGQLEPVAIAFPLGDGGARGRLELSFDDGRVTLARGDEIALEVLCDHLGGALDRLDEGAVIALQPGSRKR